MKKNKEKKSLEKVEKTVVPGFFSRQPLLPAQRFLSSPAVAPSHTPADMSQSNSSNLSLPVSQGTNKNN